MIFTETPIKGAWIIDIERIEDERGYFARTWARDEFAQHGLTLDHEQHSVSYNKVKGTLRGMHYQIAPYAETKLIRCIKGAIQDVVVDLRPESPTFKHWHSVEMNAENLRALYIPHGCGHGFITLEDDSLVNYLISGQYHPASARGVRWNDPVFGIVWQNTPTIINTRDASYADFTE